MLPSGTPPVFRATCSLTTTATVAAGGRLQLDTPGLDFRILDVDAGGACTSPLAFPHNMSGSPTITLTCSDGLPAGTALTVELRRASPYPFTTTLTVTYNAGEPDAITESLPLTTPLLPPLTVNYPAGWNLVGAPAGTVLDGAQGPLFTFQAGDTNYEALPQGTPLQSGLGYWAYFPSPCAVTLASVMPPDDSTVPLPAGQWVMLGNPLQYLAFIGSTPNANLVRQIYDPVSGEYLALPFGLTPGQGAWVWSSSEGSAEVFPSPIP